MTLGALAFASPWLLTALVALPLIYWLLRTVPPLPKRISFPPTRILVGLENREKTPAKTPWWLMLIRLLAAALIICALAEPILNANESQPLKGDGPVAIVVDNGWASATGWAHRQAMVERIILQAENANRPVVVAPTAQTDRTIEFEITTPTRARQLAAALVPQPYAPDRSAALKALQAALAGDAGTGASVVWVADGIDHAGGANEFAQQLAQVASDGSFVLSETTPDGEALAVDTGLAAGGKLKTRILRANGGLRPGVLHAFSARGERLGEAEFELAVGAQQTSVEFDLPLEIRNQVTRVALAGGSSAGAVSLLDQRSRWNRVGLLSGSAREKAQPLLAPLYYIERALAPFAEIVKPRKADLSGGVREILNQGASVLMLADIGTLSGNVQERIGAWVRKGGVLVRFAGPRLEKGGDSLLPVPLRIGGRTLGGALSWSTPQPLAAFDDTSLFAGLDLPDDVRINRQVLADPTRLGSNVQVWARLSDGTPLVTATKRGDGYLILFHVTANSDWSNLPISGLFVEMLRRVSSLGQLGGAVLTKSEAGEAGLDAMEEDDSSEPISSDADTPTNLAPVETLDGFGRLAAPPPTAKPLLNAQFDKQRPSFNHPPGYYGATGTPRALNIANSETTLEPLPPPPQGTQLLGYESRGAVALKPWLLGAAFCLLLLDMLAIVLLQTGGPLRGRGQSARTAAANTASSLVVIALPTAVVIAATSIAASDTARAQSAGAQASADAVALAATRQVTLGYVLTGNPRTDETSAQGLTGLGRILTLRTTVIPGPPVGVDILEDEIAFFPVLYWPVLENASALPDDVVSKIDAYMKQGGMIIFDTGDYGRGTSGGVLAGPDGTPLQRILGRLDIPRLEPVPEGHVLTKSFYLLRSFPGRWDGGQLWVEAGSVDTTQDANLEGGDYEPGGRQARKADGVTSILITSNDFASAWAIDETGRPYYPLVPGGRKQREYAFRTGINIVMHALTGNYKADQVHVPALLGRLGQ